MRDLNTLYELFEWYDDPAYKDYIQAKERYKQEHTFENFIDAQSQAVALYSMAKELFSRDGLSLDELHAIRDALLHGLWQYKD